MKRLLGLLLLLAAPAFAQTDMVGSPCNMTDGSCAGVLSSFVAPSGCVSTSVPFFGTDLKLRCGVFTDDPTTGTISAPTVSARNVTATALATPGAITVTNQGTPGTTTVTYKLVALLADGTTTEAGAASTTTTSNATLSATNFNRLTWSAVTGATSYRVYRTVAPTTPSTTGIVYSGTALTVDDTGLAGGGETAPTVNGTGVGRANRVLVGDGTTAAPSISFAGAVNNGLYNNSGFFTAVAGGVASAVFTSTATTLYNALYVNGTAIQTSPGAATLQLGAADVNGSPVAQTLKVQSAITGTNLAPAAWTLQGSLGTGNATPGAINITSGGRSATSGTTAQTAIVRHGIGWSKVLTNNSAIAVVNATLASNTGMGMIVRYLVEVFDGTNLQTESGVVSINGVNKAGAFTIATPTKAGNVQALSSGTLAVTWAASSANPSVISVNANSSLTPSTGYPRITYTIDNLSQQAVAMQ